MLFVFVLLVRGVCCLRRVCVGGVCCLGRVSVCEACCLEGVCVFGVCLTSNCLILARASSLFTFDFHCSMSGDAFVAAWMTVATLSDMSTVSCCVSSCVVWTVELFYVFFFKFFF